MIIVKIKILQRLSKIFYLLQKSCMFPEVHCVIVEASKQSLWKNSQDPWKSLVTEKFLKDGQECTM